MFEKTLVQKWPKFLKWIWGQHIKMNYSQNLRKDPLKAKYRLLEGLNERNLLKSNEIES